MNIKSFFQRYVEQDGIFLAAFPAVVWLICFLVFPISMLLYKSLVVHDASFIVQLTSFLDITHRSVLLRSAILSSITALSCLILSYPIAYYFSFCASRFVKNLGVLLCTLPLWVNMLVQVYAWFFVLDRQGLMSATLQKIGLLAGPMSFMNSFSAVMIVMIQTYLPYVTLPLIVAFDRFDKRLIEASMDLGATWQQTFNRVLFPLTLSGAQVGFFLVLVMTFGEYALPTLLGGGKHMYVGTLISNYILVSQDMAAGASFTLIACICLMILVSLFALIFRWLSKGIRIS